MQIAYLVDHISYLPELARLHHEEWSYLRPDETLDERIVRLRNCCGRRQLPTALIALDAQELLGSALLVAQDMTTRPDLSPWLAGVYVRREHRRRGIATSLITRVEAEARSLGSSRVTSPTCIRRI